MDDLLQRIDELLGRVAELEARNAELEARNAELERQLKRRGKKYTPKPNARKRLNIGIMGYNMILTTK